ncbi:OPT oligopeptide transporter protein [Ceratobasidium sp. AG-Ba]|nr:OPT oligopeptide transporter protein [Ceratobasidium sp. AG-Ba]
MYFGLQTGWISMMSMQSALLGYLVSLMFPRPMTPQENVVLQTTAVATGTMPLAAGFVGIIPALGLLDYEHDKAHPIRVGLTDGILWGCAVALFGVFLAPPLRRQMIVKEELVFPSGTATAQLISVLHEKPDLFEDAEHTRVHHPESRIARRRGYEALSTEDPDATTFTQTETTQHSDTEDTGSSNDFQRYDVTNSWRILCSSFSASSLLTSEQGMVFGWGVLSPISKLNGWAPGPTGDMITGARGWILWVSLAIICANSFVSITPTIYRIGKSVYISIVSKRVTVVEEDVPEDEPDSRLVPNNWVWGGLLVSTALGTILVWVVFGYEGIKPWATVLRFMIGGVLSHLGARALGETDLNPVSALGKISQLFFAILQPGNVVANIIAGGVAEAGAQQAGDLMQDLKTGHLLHASPRAQFYGQLVGSVTSIFFPAPTAYVWLSFARLIGSGNALPSHAKPFIISAAIIAALGASFKMRALRQGKVWAIWVPSGVAFAIGFLNTPSFTIARLIGGIIELLYRRRVRRLRAEGKPASDVAIIILASGFVLGEGVMSIVGLVMKSFGVGVLSCGGCWPGGCPSC